MGQYYMGVLINTKNTNKIKTIWTHHFDCGAKLTEFSWIGNYPMQRAALELIEDAHYVAYIGDYADIAWDEYKNKNKQSLVSTKRDYIKYYRKAWHSERKNKNTTILLPTTEKWSNGKTAEENIDITKYDLINYSKGIYINLEKYAKENTKTDEDGHKWTPNPISLLTAIGNGNGGGDYYKEIGKEHIGTWAFDLIKLGMNNATLKETMYHFDQEI